MDVVAECAVCREPVSVGWGPHTVPLCPRCGPVTTGLEAGAVPSPSQRDPLVERAHR